VEFAFPMRGHQPMRLYVATCDGQKYLAAPDGPIGAEMRVFAADGTVAAEIGVGTVGPEHAILHVVSAGEDRPVLVAGYHHGGNPRLIQRDLLTGERTGPTIPLLADPAALASYTTSSGVVLVVADSTGALVRFDAATGVEIGSRIDAGRPLYSVTACASGSTVMLAAGGEDGTVTVWNGTGKLLWSDKLHFSHVAFVELVPDGDRILGVSGGQVRRWDAVSGQILPGVFMPEDVPRIAVATVGGRPCVVVGHDVYLDRLDLRTGDPIGPRLEYPDGVEAVACAGGIAYVADGYTISQVDIATGTPLQGRRVTAGSVREEIFEQLDELARLHILPDLNNGYHHPLGARLHAFRDDASRWALFIEVPVFNIVQDDVEDILCYLGNGVHVPIGYDDGDVMVRIDELDELEDELESGAVENPQFRVRGKPVTVKGRFDDLVQLLRALGEQHRDHLLATDEEVDRRRMRSLTKVLTLYDWHHPVIPEEKPSESEAFRMIAAVLETGDPARYAPTEEPNTHWSHWPDAGTL